MKRGVTMAFAALGLFASLQLAPADVRAQEAGGGSVQEKDQVLYKKKTVIDFSDVTIQGELTKPEGSYILNRKKAKFKLLIRVRETFHPEMMRSVDHL